jgi:AcrR family transcriptional regulator
VRDILAAAGQRSGGALHYHFGGKEGLLRELIADAATLFDQARLRKLAALQNKRTAPVLRDVLRILADPFAGEKPEHVAPRGYSALLNSLQVEHYEAFIQGVEGLDVGYRQCIQRLRELLPDVPRQRLNQRIRLMMLFLFSAASARERAGGSSVWQVFWSQPGSRETLLDCLEGMLTGPSA